MKPIDYCEYHISPEIIRQINCSSGFRLNLFPCPLFIYKLTNFDICSYFSNLILKEFDDDLQFIWQKQKKERKCNTTITTHDNLHLNIKFEPIINLLTPIIKTTLDTLNIDSAGYNITSMWANIQGPGGYLANHIHSNSFLSGVLYLNLPGKDKGLLYFEDPKIEKISWHFDSLSEKSVMFQDRGWNVEPEIGKLIIFPSWLRHGTFQGDWEKNEYRVSLSFNIIPKFKCSTNTMRYCNY